MFIDVHCHLDSRFFSEKEIKGVVKRAKKARVIMVASGIGIDENKEVLGLVERFDSVKAVLGIHPSDLDKVKDVSKEIKFIRGNADKIIGIGEVGLDFLEEGVDKAGQVRVFSRLIKLSLELDLPLIVHSRKAEMECVELLESLGARKVVMHCFSGRKMLIDRIVSNGWSFSIPASVKYNEHFQNLVSRVDLGQLLCETDSPFLHPSREGRNEPCFVVESYKAIAKVKGLKLGEVERAVEGNFRRVFGEA